jgi:annexin A7/11
MTEEKENIYEKEAEALRKAMEGFGTDEDALIKTVTSHKTKERLKIRQAYEEKYNKKLLEDLKSELSGKFEDAMLALFKDPVEYDAECLYLAMKGEGTDEQTLIEIISSRPNWIIEKIKKKYREIYDKNLEEDIKGDTSGDFQKILIALINNERNDNKEVNKEECKNVANQLKELKDEDWKIENEGDVFYKYIITSSQKELSLVAREYYKLTGETILESIEKKFKGDIKELIKTILYSTVSPSEYFATRINKAIEGFGTDNKTLIRILISRCEIDMNLIKRYYKKLYNKDMVDDIKNDISGDYQKLMLELIK